MVSGLFYHLQNESPSANPRPLPLYLTAKSHHQELLPPPFQCRIGLRSESRVPRWPLGNALWRCTYDRISRAGDSRIPQYRRPSPPEGVEFQPPPSEDTPRMRHTSPTPAFNREDQEGLTLRNSNRREYAAERRSLSLTL